MLKKAYVHRMIIEVASKQKLPISSDEISNSLINYFDKLIQKNNIIKNKNLNINKNKNEIIEKIIDCYVGSLKTRLGPAPDHDQRLFYLV